MTTFQALHLIITLKLFSANINALPFIGVKKKIRIEACAVEHKIERDFLTPEVTKKDVSTSVLPSSGCYGLYLVPFLGCETGQEGFTDVQLQPGGLAKAPSPLPCGMLPWEWQRYSLDISYDLCALLLWSFDSNC